MPALHSPMLGFHIFCPHSRCFWWTFPRASLLARLVCYSQESLRVLHKKAIPFNLSPCSLQLTCNCWVSVLWSPACCRTHAASLSAVICCRTHAPPLPISFPMWLLKSYWWWQTLGQKWLVWVELAALLPSVVLTNSFALLPLTGTRASLLLLAKRSLLAML